MAVCGSLWQFVVDSGSPVTVSGSVRYFVAVCGILWHSVAVCSSLWQSVAVCGSLWLTVAVSGNVWYYVAVGGSLWQTVTVCGSFKFYKLIFNISLSAAGAKADCTLPTILSKSSVKNS